MPGQKLALETGGPPRLELEWGGYMREFKIILDGDLIGEIDGGQRELKQGRQFPLPDGSTLSIRLRQSLFLDELEILRDGQPLPGSAVDPYNKFSFTISLVFFWGVISVIAGVLHALDNGTLMLSLGFSQYSIVFGLLLIGCSYLIYRQFRWAILLVIALFFADWFVAIKVGIDAGAQPNSLGILVRILVAVLLFQGWRAMGKLQQQS